MRPSFFLVQGWLDDNVKANPKYQFIGFNRRHTSSLDDSLVIWNFLIAYTVRYLIAYTRGVATNFRLGGGQNLTGGTDSGESKPPTP